MTALIGHAEGGNASAYEHMRARSMRLYRRGWQQREPETSGVFCLHVCLLVESDLLTGHL